MGRTYSFECARCGYFARVAGGAAEGEHFAVQTITCADCRALYDAVVRVKTLRRLTGNPLKTAPKFAVVLNRLPPRGVQQWLKFKPGCPAQSWHRIRLCKQPDKCPQCGSFLEPNAIPFRIWD